jgi:GTPase SAR1 family protein
MYEKEIEIKKKKIRLEIWDSLGQEKFRSFCSNNFRWVEGVIFIYDIMNDKSLENLSHWIRLAECYLSEDVAWVIIGNKVYLHIILFTKL